MQHYVCTLSYFKLLEKDESILGERRGKVITYKNVGNYFDNTAFKTIVENGWYGTNIEQSEKLGDIIKKVITNDRTLILAVKKSISNKASQNIAQSLKWKSFFE